MALATPHCHKIDENSNSEYGTYRGKSFLGAEGMVRNSVIEQI